MRLKEGIGVLGFYSAAKLSLRRAGTTVGVVSLNHRGFEAASVFLGKGLSRFILFECPTYYAQGVGIVFLGVEMKLAFDMLTESSWGEGWPSEDIFDMLL